MRILTSLRRRTARSLLEQVADGLECPATVRSSGRDSIVELNLSGLLKRGFQLRDRHGVIDAVAPKRM